MKLRFGLYIFVLAVCVFLVLWHRKNNTKLESPSIQSASPILSTNTNIEQQAAQPSNQKPTPYAQASSNIAIAQSNSQSRVEMLKEAFAQKNAPIDFYGKVIDQDSNALSDAKVNITVRHWELTENAMSRMIHLEKETDADGRFEFHGETGDGFGVGITKDGYELEPNRYGFGPTAGSFNNPVIFKMWGTNIHEQLITGNKSFELIPDGRPYFINLTDGTISESAGGDLKVWIQYTNQITGGQVYDWSAGIDVINGGLLEVQQTIMNSGFLADPPFAMYSAPTDGYTPSFHLQQQIKGGQDGEIGNRYFYLQLKNGGEYGRMSINLFAPYGHLHPGLIRISYAINPSGSRILR